MRIPILTALLFTFTSTAFAQDKILVADDSSSGTYAKMVAEIKTVCNDTIAIEEIKVSGGALGNLNALANNKASVALLHSDVIYAMAMADPSYRKLKTLVALYPEEIHIVALRNSGLKSGGTMGFGGKEVEFKDLAGLAGRKMGASGGGVYTARILQGQGEGKFEVVQFDSGKELLPALDSGQVQAILFVGGAPLHNIEALDGSKYKLLPIPESIGNKVQAVYHTATITYPNLRSGPIRTLAPDAIALTRVYKTPQMIAPQAKFRTCFYEKLDNLKETPGLHPKWQAIEPENHGTWEWYDLPGTSPPPAAGPAAPGPVQGKTQARRKPVN
jgi:TRAP-type uncharacterized transport system substrate-binding protein